MVRFSRRVPSDLGPNRLAKARARIGVPMFDLTESNPTRCDLPYPTDLLEVLADPCGLRYQPDPRGVATARQAIANSYRTWGADVVPDNIVLTASTSEAYGFLMRILAEPGESILVPSPSYPLFDQLARLDDVRLHRYRLEADERWRIDPADLATVPADCRAVVAVHPNNPTGSFVHPDDADRLATLAARHQLALIVDEVFLRYPHGQAPGADRTFADNRDCLTMTLGGLSKSVGLPQMKLAWIVVCGPDDEVDEALERLDYVSDAYLSVSSPVSFALAELMHRCEPVHDAIASRCRANLDRLEDSSTVASYISVLSPDGGWSAVLRIPSVVDEEELALELLENHGVAVHPGYLFDFPSDGHLVISLLPPEPIFAEGVRRLFDTVERMIGSLSGVGE
jgi:aspartate/methionine/tyrosine aminotransferase